MVTIVQSNEEYEIGTEMKKLLSADKIEYLAIQTFNRDKSSILKWFNHINNKGKRQFANYIQDTDDEQDILKGELKKAVELDELSDVPEIEIKPKVVKVGNMTRLAISASFSEDFLKDDTNAETFNRTMEKLAASLLFVIKERAFYKMVTHAKAPTVELIDGEWVDGNDNIDDDLDNIIFAFENQDNWILTLNQLVSSRRAFKAMRKYYRTVNGSFNANDILPDDGVVRKIEAIPQLEHGLIGIDLNDKPCALFYNVDSRYNTYNKTKEQSFINVILDDTEMEGVHPHKYKVEMFVEFGFGILNPYGLLFQPDV